jgi:hypothetical protein
VNRPTGIPTYVGPAIIGWRSWRVLAHAAVGQPLSYRLCACGTQGIPKAWEPRAATQAVCGTFHASHEAPWESCHCGIHAYADEADARAHWATFVEHNATGLLGWAFGRVSLWGRIVEHETGWRAQYAYPYDLTVYGTEILADKVRNLYLVDVEQAAADELPRREPDPEPEPSVRELLAEFSRDVEPRKERWRAHYEAGPQLPANLDDVGEEEALQALFAAHVARLTFERGLKRRSVESAWGARPVDSAEVLEGLLTLRKIPGGGAGWGSYMGRDPDLYKALRRQMLTVLKGLVDSGLAETGKSNEYGNSKAWRITEAGTKQLGRMRPPNITYYEADWDPPHVAVNVSTARSFRALHRPPIPFREELLAESERWRSERHAAARVGRRALRNWLTEQRARVDREWHIPISEAELMGFTEDEVLQALRAVTRNGPQPMRVAIQRIAPGATRSEASAISQRLVRLRGEGRVAREGEPGDYRWRAIAA